MGRKPYLWEPGENEEAIEVMFPKGSTQEDRDRIIDEAIDGMSIVSAEPIEDLLVGYRLIVRRVIKDSK